MKSNLKQKSFVDLSDDHKQQKIYEIDLIILMIFFCQNRCEICPHISFVFEQEMALLILC